MNTTINIRRLIPVFLGCLLIALLPSLFFWYLATLMILTKIFVVICVIDYIRKSRMRKNIGLILASMFLAAIAALSILYFTNSFS